MVTENEVGEPTGAVNRRMFLSGSANAVGALLASSAPTAFAATPDPATAGSAGASAEGTTVLKAGAGRAVIALPASLLPFDGFTTVHDDLYVRILLLDGGSRRTALVVLDLTSVSAEAIAAMRKIITAAANVRAEDIVVTVTHTFSAPHVLPTTGLPDALAAQAKQYVRAITQATTEAVAAAMAGLRPARVGFGSGTCDVNVNRDVRTVDGWWLGTGESGPSDKSVGVTRVDGLDGKPIAVLVNYGVQSSVMMDSVMANGDLPISADLAGAAVAHIEDQYGADVVGFFLVGACGDQAPTFRSKRYTIDKDRNWSQTDARDGGWLLLTVQGERLGTEAVRICQTIDTSGSDTAGTRLRLVTDSVTVNAVVPPAGELTAPATQHTFTPAGTAEVPIWILQVGSGVFVGVEPELSCDTAIDIKRHSPFPHTAVLSMLEGGAKNMAEARSYARISYEAMDSSYAAGSAELVAARISALLHSLRA